MPLPVFMLKSIPTALISREDKEKHNDKDKENTMTKKNTMTRTIFSLSPERGRLAAGEKKRSPLGAEGFGGGRKPLAKMPHRVYNMLFNGVKGPGI